MSPTPQIHADMIKAWADGYDIEAFNPERQQWVLCPVPGWFADIEYRARPGVLERAKEPVFREYFVNVAPDVFNEEYVELANHNADDRYNLRLLFCDDELVDAEVVGGDASDEDAPW
jgi:hypothetical protein